MKKFITLALVALLAAVTIAVAGDVYGRSSRVMISAGTGTWTNTLQYAALKLQRIYCETNLAAAGTITVTRVDGSFTHAVGSIVATAVSTATFTEQYMLYGDYLVFTEGAGSNGCVTISYEVQKH